MVKAKIKTLIYSDKAFIATKLWLLIFLFFPKHGFAQNTNEDAKKKKIEILWADELSGTFDSLKGQIRTLDGNVKLKHNQNFLSCNKAIQIIDSSLVKAFGNVHLKKPDTLDIYSKLLTYSSETKFAKLRNKVELHDSTGILYTDSLDFDLNTDIGTFWGGGKYKTDSSTLTSNRGTYYHREKTAYFIGNVLYEKKDGLTITSDTMKYDTEKDIVWFVTKTKIVDDKSVIYTNTGFYNTETGEASFGNKSLIRNKNNKLSAEKIKYSKDNKQGIAVGNAVWEDTVENIMILADSIIFLEDSSYVLATRDPLMIDFNEKDTIYMSSDTLISYRILKTDTLFLNDTSYELYTDTLKAYKAFKNVKIFRSRFSGICDSLSFTYVDTTFRIYQNPMLWVDTSQFLADSVYIFSKNEKTDKIFLYQNAFVISMSHPELFNQVKGRQITAFFEEDSLRRVFVDGNAESLYFIKDDSSAYVGMNKTTSSTIKMYFKKKEIDRIICLEQPEGVFTPMKLTSPSNRKLDGYAWYYALKPKSAYDVVRNNRQYQIDFLDNIFKNNSDTIENELENEPSDNQIEKQDKQD